jgi:uncharacterized damage-inducible protein DinB
MKTYIEGLIDYNYWANGLIIKFSEKLTTDQFLEEIPFFGNSLRSILAHTMFAEWVWLDRMQGIKMLPQEVRSLFRADKYPDLSSLVSEWFEVELRMRDFLNGLEDGQLDSSFTYTRSGGATFENRYLDILTQLAFHGMQHRAECAAILTRLGHSPGNIDYITYLRP